MNTENKILTFGDGDKQIALFEQLKTGLRVVDTATVSLSNHGKLSCIKCIGQNTELICCAITKYPNIKCLNSTQHICKIIRNNQKHTLYGTVPAMLFNIYANKGRVK
ncbi:MAG: hypothetical protein KBS86_03960 [Proteobacteria bacterium]|nr:hypothetical protein [Candidatus Enterousia scatequi]